MREKHTPYYCEENIWWLAQDARFVGKEPEVVFISNASRTVAFAHQRAAQHAGDIVVWDYHVVLLAEGKVWDLDCTLGAPLTLQAWLDASFDPNVRAAYAPMFKCIDAAEYVAHFASDRRHMRNADGTWQAPPPAWPLIGAGHHTLEAFVDVRDATWGVVMTLEALRQRG